MREAKGLSSAKGHQDRCIITPAECTRRSLRVEEDTAEQKGEMQPRLQSPAGTGVCKTLSADPSGHFEMAGPRLGPGPLKFLLSLTAKVNKRVFGLLAVPAAFRAITELYATGFPPLSFQPLVLIDAVAEPCSGARLLYSRVHFSKCVDGAVNIW